MSHISRTGKHQRPPTRGRNLQPQACGTPHHQTGEEDHHLSSPTEDTMDDLMSEPPSDLSLVESPNAKRLQELAADVEERPLSLDAAGTCKFLTRPASAGGLSAPGFFEFAPVKKATKFNINIPKQQVRDEETVAESPPEALSAQHEHARDRVSPDPKNLENTPEHPLQEAKTSTTEIHHTSAVVDSCESIENIVRSGKGNTPEIQDDGLEQASDEIFPEHGQAAPSNHVQPTTSSSAQQDVVDGADLHIIHTDGQAWKLFDEAHSAVAATHHERNASEANASEPDDCMGDDSTYNKSTESTAVSSQAARRGMSGQSHRHSTPLSPVHSAQYRVSKGTLGQQLGNGSGKETAQVCSTTERIPSEEDLLALVVQRVEHQKQLRYQARAREAQLQGDNAKLQQDLAMTREKMEEARAALSTREKDFSAQLEGLKGRYGKLKAWAISMNKDFNDIAKQRIQHRLKMEELKLISSDISTSIVKGKSAITEGLDMVAQMRGEHASLSIMVAQQSRELESKDSVIDERSNALGQAAKENDDLKNHIKRLQGSQERADKRAAEQSEQWMATVHKMCTKLHTIDATTSLLPLTTETVEQAFNMVKELCEKPLVETRDLASLDTTIVAISEKIETYQAKITMAAADQQTEYGSCFAEVKEIIEGMRPEFQELLEAKQKQALLEERVRGKDASLTRTDDTIKQAHARESGLLKQIESMCSNFTQSARQMEAATNLRDQLSQKTTEWNFAKTQIAQLHTKLQTIEAELSGAETVKMELESTQHRLRDVQEQYAQCEEINNSLQTQLEDQRHLLEAKENERFEQVEALQADLTNTAEKRNSTQAEIQAVASDRDQLVQKLQDSQRKVEGYIHLCKNLEDKLVATEANVAELRPAVAKAEELSQLLAFKDKEIDLLCGKQGQFDEVANKLSEQSSALLQSNMEVRRLNLELKDAHHAVESMTALRVQLEDANARTVSLERQLQDTQVEAGCVETLREQLASEQRLRANLDSQLKAAEEEKQRCVHLQVQSELHDFEVAELDQALGHARAEVRRLLMVETNRNALRDEIEQLKRKVAKDKEMASRIFALMQDSQQKDSQIEVLKGRLVKLEAESQSWSQLMCETASQDVENEFDPNADALISGAGLEDRNIEGVESETQVTTTDGVVVTQEVRRRAAKRSLAGRSPTGFRQDGHLSSGVQDILPESTMVTNSQAGAPPATQMVPNSQHDGEATHSTVVQHNHTNRQQGRTDMVEQGGQGSSSSELSEYSCVFEDGFEANDATAIPDPDSFHLNRSGRDSQKAITSVDSQNAITANIQSQSQRSSSRPPSSLTDMMLLGNADDRTSGEHDSRGPHLAAQRGQLHASHITVPTVDDGSSRLSKRSEQGLQLRGRTPMPTGSQDAATPRAVTPLSTTRDRPLPNSTAKRAAEASNDVATQRPSGKRLKRNPGNLDVKDTRKRSLVYPDQSQSNDATPSSARVGAIRSASVVGTNAPPPKSGQKAKKPARKGSRQDRYADKFNQSS